MLKLTLKIIFGLAYMLAGTELFLRILAPMPIVPRYMAATAYGIRGNEPNRAYWHTSADFAIQIRTNSKGIRADEEIPYEKPPGVKRIVVLGDSFGMGYEVNFEDTFLERMRRELQAAGVHVQVVNLSVSGYGTAEELISLREEGLKYHPDLVLLCWNSTDYPDNCRCGLFELKEGKLVQTGAAYLPGVAMQQRLNRFRIYEWTAAHSQVYSFVREFTALQVVKPLLVLWRGGLHDPGNASDRPPEESYSTQLAVALLREIQSLSHSAGAELLVLDVPKRASRTEFYSVYPRDAQGETYGVRVVNPIEDFRQHAGKLIYWERSQGHFTPFGCDLVGRRLARYILQERLLASH